MNTLKRLSLLALTFFITACTTAKTPPINVDKSSETTISDGHNTQNSLDWAGTYAGTLPCADCEGITTVLTLTADGYYRIIESYQGHPNASDPYASFSAEGRFHWLQDGSRIQLDKAGDYRLYFIGEDHIRVLDSDGKPIDGALTEYYILHKARSD